MEIWLKHKNSDQMLLPVTPEEFYITEKSGNTTVVINSLGEINLLGKRGLKEGSLSSFFPNQIYPFAQGGFEIKKIKHTAKSVVMIPMVVYSKKRKKYITSVKKQTVTTVWYTTKKVATEIDEPYDFVEKILGWKEKGTIVNLIIGSNINFPISIETFKYGEQDGTGDVYYTIGFKEYRMIELIKKPKKKKKSKKNKKKTKDKKRKSKSKKNQKSYKTKKGDTLKKLAKKFYGSSSEYNKIYNANKSKLKNKNTVPAGITLTIP